MRSPLLVVVALLGACSSFESAPEKPKSGDDAGAEASVAPPPDAGPTDASSDVDASTPSAAYAAVVLADSPAAYWRCTESTGASSLASTVNMHFLVPATNNEPSLQQAGLFSGAGRAVAFDGTNGQRFGSNTIPFRLPAAFAFEAWINSSAPADLVPRTIFAQSDGTRSYIAYVTDGTIYVETFADAVQRYVSAPLPAPGEWHHLVVQGSSPQVFDVIVDTFASSGVQVGTQTLLSTRSFTVGAADDGAPSLAAARLAEIAFYDHVLGPDRITAHYIAGRVP